MEENKKDLAREKRKHFPYYTKGEEIFNAVSHIVGGALGLVVWITLMCYSYPNGGYMASVSIFGICVIILYTMSALYHFLHVGTAKKVFRVFDHCTIFLLIAGTYTPFCVIALDGQVIGIWIIAIEWFLAILGITGNAIALNNKVIKGFSMSFYVIMGWLILIAAPTLVESMSIASIVLLLVGGIAYTGGIIFFAFGKKVKYFHSIWHLFDLAGTFLHFLSILLLLL